MSVKRPRLEGEGADGARTQLRWASTSIQARTHAMHLRRSILRNAIESSQFAYLHEVKGHHSCINALAFSRGSGQWMASGGDDMRILIRDLFDFDESRPGPPETSSYRTRARLLGHTSNVFSLTWSADNVRLYSGGNDQIVHVYDLHYDDAPALTLQPRIERRMPTLSFAEHEHGIREVSAHPTHPHLVMSSSDGGQVFVVDTRLPPPHIAQSLLFFGQVASAQWNPNPSDGNTFVATSSHDPHACTALYDVRKLPSAADGSVHASHALVRYASQLRAKLPAGVAMAKPDPTGAQFDPSGRFVVTDMSLYHPTLYSVDDSEPLATMSSVAVHPHMDPCQTRSAVLPRHLAGYRNSCTIKRGSFGFEAQTGELYYVAGSDDFRGYGWHIPPVQELLDARMCMPYNDWLVHDTIGNSAVWFRNALDGHTDTMLRPPELACPTFTLEGSRSIVNSTLCHPTLPMVATAGIERLVRLHYATPMSLQHTQKNWDKIRPRTRQRMLQTNFAAVLRAMRRSVQVLSYSGTPTLSGDEAASENESEDESAGEQDERDVHGHSDAAAQVTASAPTSAELDDEEAIALFDELLREEEDRTLFSRLDFASHTDDSSEPDSDTDTSIDEDAEDEASDLGASALEFLLEPDGRDDAP